MQCETNCECGIETDFYDEMERKLMVMTFWAHKEVLFDKIKERIENEEGEKLEKIASLLVDAWKNKIESGKETERKQEDFSEKLREAFE